jgi:hypothetical protein
MNIADVKAADTLPVYITLPDEAATATSIIVHVMSFDSKDVTKVTNKYVNAQIKEERLKGKTPTVEGTSDARINTLAVAVKKIDWGTDDWDGAKPEPSTAFFKDLLDRAPWFFVQIEEVGRMSEAFFTAPKLTLKSK